MMSVHDACRSKQTKKELWKLSAILNSHGGIPKAWRTLDKKAASKRSRETDRHLVDE